MKKVTLNKDSWHYKYYKSIVTEDDAPKTLCPYFWTMVALIFFSPVIFFFRGLFKVIEFFDNKKSKRVKTLTDEQYQKKFDNKEKTLKILIIIGKVVLGLIVGFFVFIFGLLLFSGVQKLGIWGMIRGILLTIGFGTICYFLLGFIIDKSHYVGKFFKLKIFTIPIQMIIATYKRACPLVDWKSNETELVEVKN